MVTINVMGNKIGKEQLSKLQEMMKAHPTLVSLCGISGDATGANLSGIKMDADDAVVVADELTAKGALAKFTVSGDSSVSKPLTIESSMTEANFSGKGLGASGAIMLAAFIPKCQ